MNLTMKQARILANKTQKEMANILGVNHNTYGGYEKDYSNMKIKTALKFCEETSQEISKIFC